MKLVLLIFVTFLNYKSICQLKDNIPNQRVGEQIIVTAYKEKTITESSLNIDAIKIDSNNKYGSYNLTELL